MANLSNWDPMTNALAMHRAINQLFEDSFWQPGTLRAAPGLTSMPVPVDVYETDDQVVVKASVPGLAPEDINVTVTGDLLSISGQYQQEAETAKGQTILHQERRQGAFSRQFTLPAGIDTSRATASFENGVLTLEFPKSEQARPKNIRIETKKS